MKHFARVSKYDKRSSNVRAVTNVTMNCIIDRRHYILIFLGNATRMSGRGGRVPWWCR